MNRAAILIGINQVNGLPILNDAVDGAKRMFAWVETQSIPINQISLITDENEPVTIGLIQAAIARFLEPVAGIEQLIIYFAGHGLNKDSGEIWLLSQGLTWANESVHVARSVDYARQSIIPHIIFISDACRTAAAGITQQSVMGAPIFPLAGGGSTAKAVDQFFACALGNPALEVQEQNSENASVFRAVYTDALLELLNGKDPSIINPANDGKQPDGLIRPWPLNRALPNQVAKLLVSKGLHTKISQSPEARISSDPDSAWIARLSLPRLTVPRVSAALVVSTDHERKADFNVYNRTMHPTSQKPWHEQSLSEWIDTTLGTLMKGGNIPTTDMPDRAREIVSSVHRRCAELPSLSLETQCGVRLHGGRAVGAFSTKTQIRWSMEGKILQASPKSSDTYTLLVLEDGTGLAIPLLPEFIAEVHINNSQVEHISYEAYHTSPFYDTNPKNRIAQRYLREFLGKTIELGILHPSRETLTKLTNHSMMTIMPDPVLLLYLAYALNDKGMFDQLKQLLIDNQVEPLFDVKLVACMPSERLEKLGNLSSKIPLLARGWSSLPYHQLGNIATDMESLSQMRKPSLWTHFTAAAVPILQQELFSRGLNHA